MALDAVNPPAGAQLAIRRRWPFDIIKVDRQRLAPITPVMPNPETLAGLGALIRSSRLMEIAEGVETGGQLLALMRSGGPSGGPAAQVFHLSRPLSAADLIAFHGRSHRSEDASVSL